MSTLDVTTSSPALVTASTKSLDKMLLTSKEWVQKSAIRPSESTVKMSSSGFEDKFKLYVSQSDLLMRKLSHMDEDHTASLENFCDSAHLLERNTASFRCLRQLVMSSSSLTKNRLFLFPPLEDPGIDIAFNFEEPPPVTDDIGAVKYKKLCEDMEIVPISRIINSLNTQILDLKYYGLTTKQLKALTEALKENSHVQTLILQDNWLTVEMTQMISDMMIENLSIQYVSLYECRIGEEGAQKLGEVLSSFQTLKSLDLSFNELGDNGLLALRDGLCENMSIKNLNLSHNNITEDSGETIEIILTENKCIEDLNLSWNGFYTAPATRRLFAGLMNSDRIRFLNLAWNGLGLEPAVRPLSRYLRKTQNLEELDISNNRLRDQSLKMVRNAINKNQSLQIVKIGNNIYSPEAAHSLLTILAGKTKDPLFYLDMENVFIKKESKPVINKIHNIGREVKIGGILSDYEIHGPNPKKLIYDRCRYILMKPKKKKARKDFGHFILNLPENPVSPGDFEKALKKMKIKKLDKDLLKALMELFMNKKKQIECPELVKDYMTHFPDTKLPPPKPKKQKKKKGKGKKGVAEVEKEIQVHDLETADGQEPLRESYAVRQSLAALQGLAARQSLAAARESLAALNIITARQSIAATRESLAARQRSVIADYSDLKSEGSVIRTGASVVTFGEIRDSKSDRVISIDRASVDKSTSITNEASVPETQES